MKFVQIKKTQLFVTVMTPNNKKYKCITEYDLFFILGLIARLIFDPCEKEMKVDIGRAKLLLFIVFGYRRIMSAIFYEVWI